MSHKETSRSTRKDKIVGNLEKEIETTYNLPKGSVVITNPDGRDTRSDATVGAVRDNYNKKS